ncbi:MAG: hypothetical protein SVX43_18100 [Cyanobacteriota bacterium]|nr:hypothetical protein [Cyanobacteriota bacterium]
MLDFNVRYWTVAIIACFMVLGIAILFATKSRNAAIIYLSGTALILIFSYTKFSGSIRHHGNLFILLLACVWIALTETNIPKSLTRKWVVKISSIAKIAFTLLLFSHMLSSIWPYYSDLSSPFTMNQVTAQYIRRKYLKPESADRFMIAGYRNSQTSGLSALLNTRLYYLQNEDYASFVVWNQKNLREMQDTEILDTAIDESVRVNKPCILVLTHKLDETLLQRYQNNGEVELSYLKSFTGSIVKSERFHLYKITRNPSTTLGSDVPKS